MASLIAALLLLLGGQQPQAHPQRIEAERVHPRIEWRESVALGLPSAGRLRNGVRLPAAGRHFFTWDPILKRQPNRQWRRWATDDLLRTVLHVIRDYSHDHPHALRVGIGDLSRPHGGSFGPEFGGIGHATHQNGLDADIYYPRADRTERPPLTAADINPRLSQDLVDRFVRAGAVTIYVGPNTGLTGPPGIVIPLVNHDNHLHVRIAP
jgi:murein endopeptidase